MHGIKCDGAFKTISKYRKVPLTVKELRKNEKQMVKNVVKESFRLAAGSEGVPIKRCRFLRLAILMLKYKYRPISKIKYTDDILSNSTRKLLWAEITEILIAVFKIKFIVSFIIIFGTLSFPVAIRYDTIRDAILTCARKPT